MSFILENFTNIWQIDVVFQIASSRPGRLSWVAFVKQLTEMRWKEGQALFSFFSIIYSLYTSATFHSTLVNILPGRWFLFFGQISETADDRDALEGGRGDKQRTTLTTDRPLVHPPYLRAQNESVSNIPTKNTFWRQNEFLPIFGQKVAINTIGGNPCRCWSGVSGSIKLPDYKTFSGMNTGGRGGGRGGAQTKTSHKNFLLEKHKVLSFFFFIYLAYTFTFSAGSVNRIILATT